MDYLQGALFVVGIHLIALSLIGLIISIICCASNACGSAYDYDSGAKLMPASKRGVRVSSFVLILSVPILLAACLTPSTKEMCAIKVIPVIANNEGVQELPNKVVELANEWMEELKPKKQP